MRWIACLALAAGLALPLGALADSPPQLVATLTKAVAHRQYRAGTLVVVKFTVAEPGQAPGTGVPAGSAFEVQLIRSVGTPSPLTAAFGRNGHYTASIRWPGGRLARIRILAFMSTAAGAPRGFWVHLKAR